jgi:hypothetical protein
MRGRLRSSSRQFCVFVFLGSAFFVAGCGRFTDPFPPEMIAPKEVGSLEVKPLKEGMLFLWSTPKEERRGKELRFIDGYSVERKELVERGDETNPDVEFFKLAFIPDTSLSVRDELRKRAREEGKIGRRVQAPDNLRQFSFLDPSAKPGRTYLYQIVPQNQNGTDGVVKKIIKVAFNGEDSDVSLLDSDNLEEGQEDTATNNTGKGK